MGTTLAGVGRSVYRLGFEISPIILTNGICSAIPGGMLPIVLFTEAANFVAGLLGGVDVLSLDNFFAHFVPLPGSTLIEMQYGEYPFANQTVAANSGIAQPLKMSMMMSVPVNKPGGHTAKFITFLGLKSILDQHIGSGGTFTLATPTAILTNCLLERLVDVSNGEDPIPQNTWQFDFRKPLITLADAAAAQNNLMNKLTNGLPTDGSLSGPSVTPGESLTSAAPATVPTASNLTGATAGGFQPATVVPVTQTPLASP